MPQHEISIGRDRSCDIRLDNGCQYASRFHASIYRDGNVLMYRDQSSNGTLVNNVSVHNRATLISPGDSIMVAGRYPISWNVINRFLTAPQPVQNQSQQSYSQPQLSYNQPQPVSQSSPYSQEPTSLHDFNWGAFFLYPIWGFFNGCWWAFFLNILLWWTGIVLPIVFGVYGSRWSWENKNWSSVEAFESAQRSWKNWGIGLFLAGILMSFLFFVMFFSFLSAIIL